MLIENKRPDDVNIIITYKTLSKIVLCYVIIVICQTGWRRIILISNQYMSTYTFTFTGSNFLDF